MDLVIGDLVGLVCHRISLVEDRDRGLRLGAGDS